MNIAHIVQLLAEANLPHARDVSDGLRSGSLRVVADENPGAGCSCDELIDLYRMRSERKRDGLPSEHSLRMNQEAKQLADRLARFPGKKCHIVLVDGEPNVSYAVFVLADGSEAIGCTWALDARRTPPEEWERLWKGTQNAEP